jgi:parallel beta-helix repeat protein
MSKYLFTLISAGLVASLTACGGGGAGDSTPNAPPTGGTGTTAGTNPGGTGAATLYVSTSGSDTNPGTSASPWRTIQHAANAAIAGDTVYIHGGTYNEAVTVNVSGSASGGSITFQSYPGETAIVDGTGLAVPSGQSGLINIVDRGYIKIVGLEIRNYSSSSTSNIPVGVWISGAGSDIQLQHNHIHDIKTTVQGAPGCGANAANALGLAVYGTNATTALTRITIDGNQLDHLTLGCSESLTINGNVQNWSVTNNVIHDNNNIGIDAIGFEGTSPDATTDRARDGVISGNTVYNITSYGNPVYGNVYSSDGIYCDGCTQVTIERNIVHNTDFGVEVTSEHANKLSSYVTVRGNLIYANNTAGLSIGGYDASRGGTDHCNLVNNSLYNNDTKGTGAGEFQIQYYSTNNVFKNNIVYAGAQSRFMNGYTSTSDVDTDYNLYFSSGAASSGTWIWKGTSVAGLTLYRSTSGKDAHSSFADPLYVSLTTPDFHVASSSPAVNAGTNLGSSVVGTVDFAGNARVKGANIDIGGYEQ